jgi:cytochrome c-type biogenesis protein CcmH
MKRALVMCAIWAACVLPVHGVQPDEVLQDKTLEARARGLSANLRCLVCQNQSIDESDAPLARDLRILIREQLLLKKTDEQIERFLVERYGEYILLKPPLTPVTFLPWIAPFLVLAAASLFLLRRRQHAPATEALSANEERELSEILGRKTD